MSEEAQEDDEYIRKLRQSHISEKLGLTSTELDQLQTYVRWAEQEGAYYGRKDWFDKRHRRILEVLGMSEDL